MHCRSQTILIHHAATATEATSSGALGRLELLFILLHIVKDRDVVGKEKVDGSEQAGVALNVDGQDGLGAVDVRLGSVGLLFLLGHSGRRLGFVPILAAGRVGLGLRLGLAGRRLGQSELVDGVGPAGVVRGDRLELLGQLLAGLLQELGHGHLDGDAKVVAVLHLGDVQGDESLERLDVGDGQGKKITSGRDRRRQEGVGGIEATKYEGREGSKCNEGEEHVGEKREIVSSFMEGHGRLWKSGSCGSRCSKRRVAYMYDMHTATSSLRRSGHHKSIGDRSTAIFTAHI